MIEHILLLKWKEEAAEDAIANAIAQLCGLKDKIAGIVDFSSGVNFSDRARGFTHCVVMRFANCAALDAYYPHPEHQRVVQKLINPIRADSLIVDYEFSAHENSNTAPLSRRLKGTVAMIL